MFLLQKSASWLSVTTRVVPSLACLPLRAFGNMLIDPAQLTVIKTDKPKPHVPNKDLKFGTTFSDHMLEVDWTAAKGWGKPVIRPYGMLQLDPAASCLHYGTAVFEGMKAYLDADERIRLFRPMENIKRLNRSADRITLPQFDEESYLACLKELLKVEKDWIPRGEGFSLYIRPTLVGTQALLGVAPPQFAKFYTILSPVGPYYPSGFAAVKVLAETHYVRAWPGGPGFAKCGGNYGGSLKASQEAIKNKFSQVLWLFGKDEQVTEVGSMNQFFFWKRPDGVKELITAPLGDDIILPGITRDSVLNLTRGWGEFEVTERRYTVHEVIKAIEEGRMIESFGTGTAAVVSPVCGFQYKGKFYDVPLDAEDANAKSGKLTKRLWDEIVAIQYGKKEHEWSMLVE